MLARCRGFRARLLSLLLLPRAGCHAPRGGWTRMVSFGRTQGYGVPSLPLPGLPVAVEARRLGHPMKVILTALGSSGDVCPMLGLGLRRQARGHTVVLIASTHFAPL